MRERRVNRDKDETLLDSLSSKAFVWMSGEGISDAVQLSNKTLI